MKRFVELLVLLNLNLDISLSVPNSFPNPNPISEPTVCHALLSSSNFSPRGASTCTSLFLQSQQQPDSNPLPLSWQQHNDVAFAYFILDNIPMALVHVNHSITASPSSLPPLKLKLWLHMISNQVEPILQTAKLIEQAQDQLLFSQQSQSPQRGSLNIANAVTFEDHPVIRQQCNYPGFAMNSPAPQTPVSGGESINLRDPEEKYLDLLTRIISHKAVQSSEMDSKLAEILPSHTKNLSLQTDPSSLETPWDLSWSLKWTERGDWSELTNSQCTTSPSGMTENCPSTTMTASQLLMTRLLAVKQIEDNIPGHFLEAGVWRGGMTVLLRGVLASKNDDSRAVYACDSYSGIPADLNPGMDINSLLTKMENDEDSASAGVWTNRFEAGESELKKNLRRVGLYDSNTRIVKGFFNETFRPSDELDKVAESFDDPNLKLSFVRLDSDAFESIRDSLDLLWDRISVGGVVVVDDMHIPAVQKAVFEFRQRNKNAVGSIFPIGNDYTNHCNVKGVLTPAARMSDWAENGTAQFNCFLNILPTAGFFYRTK